MTPEETPVPEPRTDPIPAPLSDDHLRRIVEDPYNCNDDRHRSMAAELLELRARVTALEAARKRHRSEYRELHISCEQRVRERNDAYADLAEIAAALGAPEDTRRDCLPEMARTRIAELEAQLARVREVHQPIEALNVRHDPRGRLTQVCAGCGTDDGNWQVYPCPTIRALEESR